MWNTFLALFASSLMDGEELVAAVLSSKEGLRSNNRSSSFRTVDPIWAGWFEAGAYCVAGVKKLRLMGVPYPNGPPCGVEVAGGVVKKMAGEAEIGTVPGVVCCSGNSAG